MQVQVNDYQAFEPRAYLQDYYSSFPQESIDLLQFLVDAFQDLPPHSLTLDFGSGPTLYTAIVAAAQAHEIHVSDYLAANRVEIQHWLDEDPAAFDWQEVIRVVLTMEGREPNAVTIAEREAAIRQCVTHILPCNARDAQPIAGLYEHYDVLVANFCLEAAADDYEQWRMCMRNVAGLIKPGGHMIIAAVKAATTYAVGDAVFPVVYLTEADFVQALMDVGCASASINTKWVPADHPIHPYGGCLFVTARKEALLALEAGA